MNKRLEERLKIDPVLREMWPKMPPFKPKAKPVAEPVEVSSRLARAAKANPESVSVRVSARGADDVVVLDPPQPGRIISAYIEGNRKRYFDEGTGRTWTEDLPRSGGGVVESIYDPIKRFEDGL